MLRGMIARLLLALVFSSGLLAAADPVRPGPQGVRFQFGKDVAVAVRVLDPSLPDGRLGWERENGVWTTTWRSGGTGFLGEIFRARGLDLWTLHLQADLPGELGFRTGISNRGGRVAPSGRRLLTTEHEGEPLFAWVFPMESDVVRDGAGILLRGEGQALVVVARGNQAIAKMRQLGVEGDSVEDVMALFGKLEALRGLP